MIGVFMSIMELLINHYYRIYLVVSTIVSAMHSHTNIKFMSMPTRHLFTAILPTSQFPRSTENYNNYSPVLINFASIEQVTLLISHTPWHFLGV